MIEFETDNAAFENKTERARILHELADLASDDFEHILSADFEHIIRDINGNPIGKMTVSA